MIFLTLFCFVLFVTGKVTGDTSGQVLGSSLSTVLQNAERYKKEFQDDYVSVEHLLLAFYSDNRFGQEFFKNLKLKEEALKEVIKDVRGSQRVTDQSKLTLVRPVTKR